MSASVSGIGLGKGSPSAARRWIVRAIATGAALLLTALAAAPARADETVGTVLSATTVGSPPASYGDTTAPPDNSQTTPTAQQSNTATNTQTAAATGGAGGSATGGNAGPSQFGSNGGNAYANGGDAAAHNSLENEQSNQTSGRDRSGSGFSGSGRYHSGAQDTFVLETNKERGSGGAAARRNHARSPGHFRLGTAGRVIRPEAEMRAGHETGKASPLNGGLPGHGGQLPGQNPFFNLLSGSGGAGTGLLLLLLAGLGASIALPNHRFKAFRTPTLPWRPLAYVPPIELPG